MLIFVPLTQIDDNPYQARQEYGDTADLASRIAAAPDSYPETIGLMQIPRGTIIGPSGARVIHGPACLRPPSPARLPLPCRIRRARLRRSCLPPPR